MTARGKAWEFQLERWHADYRRSGEAFVFRCHPGAKIVSGRMVFTSKGPPDFAGLLSGGRAVMFDAKETRGKKLYWSNVPEHQVLSLHRAKQLGALAFFAIRFVGVGDYLFQAPDLDVTGGVGPDDCVAMGSAGWLGLVP